MYQNDFPLLSGTKVTYLDSAASAQKPACVLDCMNDFYRNSYANVHRGQCAIAVNATRSYEEARQTVADFINAPSQNIIFTKGATESINLVANGYEALLRAGDEVLVSIAEHHANFIPWQQICQRTGATFRVFNLLPDGRINLDDFKAKLSSGTKIVAVTQLSNVLGFVNPVAEIITEAHKNGARVLVDGAQGIAHLSVDVNKMDCDYYVFSGHKIYGPTGIGVLYGKSEALADLRPYQFGGDMIKTVSVEKTEFADIPSRFEAGTPPFVEAIGLAEAVRYVSKIGMEKIVAHENDLTQILFKELSSFPDISFMGSYPDKQGLVSFNFNGIHPSDIAFVLAKEGICVRVGHHCAMPLHHYFNQEVSLRASLGLYNDTEDIERFIKSLHKALSLLGGLR